MKLFDSHCHLQDDRIFDQVEMVINRALESGVSLMVCCGCSEKDWGKVNAIADKFKSVIPAFGIHPWYVSECSEKWLENLEYLLKSKPLAAVGEIGLDHAIKTCNYELQLDVFIKQLRLAEKLHRPVSIHCRKAWGDLLCVLKQENGSKYGGAVHSYSGSAQMVCQLQKYNLSISFSGSVTKNGNRRAREAISEVDADRLLIETDSPDILPQGYIGINEPANLTSVAQQIAVIKNHNIQTIAELTFNNAVKLFQRQ